MISRSEGGRRLHVSVCYGGWHVAWLPASSATDSAFRNRGGKVIHRDTRADATVANYSLTLQHNAITHEGDGTVVMASQAHTSFWFIFTCITLITWFTLFISHRIWSHQPWLCRCELHLNCLLRFKLIMQWKSFVPLELHRKPTYFSIKKVIILFFASVFYYNLPNFTRNLWDI